MKVKTLVAGAALALITGAPAFAEILDGNNVDEIVGLARNHGTASLETQDNGNPRIKGEANGITYYVYFMNCSDSNKDCEDLNFYAGFLDIKPTLDTINAWNRDKRFGKAYLDTDLDAVVEFDFNLEHGVTRENIDAGFSLWTLILKQYTDYIGFKP